jgi:hypothetical protein
VTVSRLLYSADVRGYVSARHRSRLPAPVKRHNAVLSSFSAGAEGSIPVPYDVGADRVCDVPTLALSWQE